MHTWLKHFADGTSREVSGPTIRHGTGRTTRHILGIHKYTSRYGLQAYEIDHIESGACLVSHLTYLSTARILGAEYVKLAPLGILPEPFVIPFAIYLRGYEFADVKTAISFEEYTSGPDYEADLQCYRNGSGVFGEQAPFDGAELPDGYISLAWVPRVSGPSTGKELREFISGRYRVRKVVRS